MLLKIQNFVQKLQKKNGQRFKKLNKCSQKIQHFVKKIIVNFVKNVVKIGNFQLGRSFNWKLPILTKFFAKFIIILQQIFELLAKLYILSKIL